MKRESEGPFKAMRKKKVKSEKKHSKRKEGDSIVGNAGNKQDKKRQTYTVGGVECG